MKCKKRKYDKIGVMFALQDCIRRSNIGQKRRMETRYYWCDECKAYHLTSKNERKDGATFSFEEVSNEELLKRRIPAYNYIL